MFGVKGVEAQVRVFEEEFGKRSVGMLRELRYFGAVETVALGNLGCRLDFNGFYGEC